jgi:hypothetical protein
MFKNHKSNDKDVNVMLSPQNRLLYSKKNLHLDDISETSFE